MPRLAWTRRIGNETSAARSTLSTMSPPLFFSAITRSTCHCVAASDTAWAQPSGDRPETLALAQHPGLAARAQSGNDNPARIAVTACRRIDPDHDAHERRNDAHPAILKARPRPERAFGILDQFAVQFLTTDPPIAILSLHRPQIGQRQVRGIVRCPTLCQAHIRRPVESLEKRHRTRRRGGHGLRLRTEPSPIIRLSHAASA